MIRPGVGYICDDAADLTRPPYGEFTQAMQSLKDRGMQQLVLDLATTAADLSARLIVSPTPSLPAGRPFSRKKAASTARVNLTGPTTHNPDDVPVVYLVNRNSARPRRSLPGALQDHDRALIVGENTFGKGLVQNPFVLDYGSMLLLTIAKYETPSGRLIQRDYSDGNLYDYYTNGGALRTMRTTLAGDS